MRRVILKDPVAAFVSEEAIEAQWQALNYLAKPDLRAAVREYEQFVGVIEDAGIEIVFLPGNAELGMDSIYVRDASIVTDAGCVLCSMGKAARSGEPQASRAGYIRTGTTVLGEITTPGSIEGGDVVWLDTTTLCVGRGYRTNDVGIAQLRGLLSPDVEVVEVPLPHWRGTGDVFHLMSMISPVDTETLLVFSPLLPVPFREWLLERGFRLVEVPDGEFESMGCNVLALAPGSCLMLEGNPQTRSRLEHAGVAVTTYRGDEISRKGCGGPTCLTRPVLREI